MGRQAGSQQALKNLWMLRPGACNVHGTFQCDGGGICWERRWLVFCVILTKRHPSSGDLSPKVGLAGGFFFKMLSMQSAFRERAYPRRSGWTPEKNGTFPEKAVLPAACCFGLCLRVPACLSWWLALLILDLLT